MTTLRFLGFLCFIIATIALVSDVTVSGTRNRSSLLTPAATHWKELSPTSIAMAERMVKSGTHPLLWDVVARPILGLSSTVLFAGAGVMLCYLGRRRRRVTLFTN
jgi:hypothetical protein